MQKVHCRTGLPIILFLLSIAMAAYLWYNAIAGFNAGVWYQMGNLGLHGQYSDTLDGYYQIPYWFNIFYAVLGHFQVLYGFNLLATLFCIALLLFVIFYRSKYSFVGGLACVQIAAALWLLEGYNGTVEVLAVTVLLWGWNKSNNIGKLINGIALVLRPQLVLALMPKIYDWWKGERKLFPLSLYLVPFFATMLSGPLLLDISLSAPLVVGVGTLVNYPAVGMGAIIMLPLAMPIVLAVKNNRLILSGGLMMLWPILYRSSPHYYIPSMVLIVVGLIEVIEHANITKESSL